MSSAVIESDPDQPVPSSGGTGRGRRHIKYGAMAVCLLVGFGLSMVHLPGVTWLLGALGMSGAELWGATILANKLVILALVILIVLYWERETLSSVGLTIPTLSDVGLGLAVFIAVLGSTIVMELLITQVFHHREPFVRGVFGIAWSYRVILLLRMPVWIGIAVGITNGVLEELIARGYAIERLRTATGSLLIAVLIPYVADLALHVSFWGWWGVLALMPAQLILVLVYLWRGNLGACIVGHILDDTFPFFVTIGATVLIAAAGHLSYHDAAGEMRYWRGDYRGAISDFTSELGRHPHDAHALRWRAWTYEDLNDYALARKDFEELIRLRPKEARAYSSLAWLLSTCPRASVRDGGEALRLAQAACELTSWKDPNDLETLAAAYAEVGDFDGAIKWEKQAIALKGKSSCKCERKRLARYEKHKPYREVDDSAVAAAGTPR